MNKALQDAVINARKLCKACPCKETALNLQYVWQLAKIADEASKRTDIYRKQAAVLKRVKQYIPPRTYARIVHSAWVSEVKKGGVWDEL